MTTAKMTKAQLLEHIAVLEAKVNLAREVCTAQRTRIKELEADAAKRGRIVPRAKNEAPGTGQAVGAPYRNAAGKWMQKVRIGFNLYTHREVQGEVAQ